MFASFEFARRMLPAWSIALLGLVSATASAAPTGGFVAVLNEQRNFGDSMNSVTFFDADDASLPLFSVYVGREPVGSNEWEEPTAITVDPANGDVYLISFDSGSGATVGVDDPMGDSQGDLDLTRIKFATIYDHWAANFQGKNVQMEGLATGPAPTGTNNANNHDYVTYASDSTQFNMFHANQVALAGSVAKIGQVVRGNGDSFYDFALDFIDSNTLVMLDDSIGLQATGDPLDDHSVRLIKKNSASPGMSTSTTVSRGGAGMDYRNGGFNGSMGQAASESWGSFIVEMPGSNDPFLMQLDGEGHSEPESMAYYRDSASGVRGVWITESDSPATGDSVAFLELDANGDTLGYRSQVGGGSPFTLTLSNNPAAGEDFDGKADNIFVDQDTGDLVIVESGFNDLADGIGPDHEPAVLRVPVDYDNGMGEIEFGTWQEKKVLNPTKDPGDTIIERGSWSAYDSANDVVWFFNPGAGTETPPNELDVYALNLTTGMTTSYLNVDDSVSLFLGDAFGDKAIFMNFAAAGIHGDYSNNGTVDAADYVVWRDNLNTTNTLPNDPNGGTIDTDQFNTWRANFGKTAGGGSSLTAVPEPASAVAAMLAVFGIGLSGRRRPR
jgi:hypothetical protein